MAGFEFGNWAITSTLTSSTPDRDKSSLRVGHARIPPELGYRNSQLDPNCRNVDALSVARLFICVSACRANHPFHRSC
jgi:hypothetical protein